MGLSLNQRGLFANVIRDPKTGLKTADGIRLPLNTEEAIFERLGVRHCRLSAELTLTGRVAVRSGSVEPHADLMRSPPTERLPGGTQSAIQPQADATRSPQIVASSTAVHIAHHQLAVAFRCLSFIVHFAGPTDTSICAVRTLPQPPL